MYHVKGLVFRNVLRELSSLRGPAAADDVLERLPKELGDRIRYGSLLSTEWVPVRSLRDMFDAIAEVTGTDTSVIRSITQRTVQYDLRGVYRVFMKLFGATRSLRVSTRFFRQYYDHGEAVVHSTRDGYADVEWRGCPEFDARVWASVLGAAEGILFASGAVEVRVHVLEGGTDADSRMRVEGFWV